MSDLEMDQTGDDASAPPREASPRKKADASRAMMRRHKRELARLTGFHDQLSERVGAMIADLASLKEVADATAALERLGRISERLMAMDRSALGLDRPGEQLSADFAELLTKAWERAYGAPPPNTDR